MFMELRVQGSGFWGLHIPGLMPLFVFKGVCSCGVFWVKAQAVLREQMSGLWESQQTNKHLMPKFPNPKP